MPSLEPKELGGWVGGTWNQDPPAAVAGVSIDSRTIQPGELFVAISGENFDGHDFIGDAAQVGAAGAVVCERRAPGLASPVPLLAVPEPREALWRLAAGHRESLKGCMVGVTGSAGKTTVKELIAGMLSSNADVARTPGNWNNHLGVPLSLLRMEPAHTFGVFELGMNHPGEIEQLAGLLKPRIGVITSVGPAHLEPFASEADVAREKSALFRVLPPDGIAVTDADGRWYGEIKSSTPCRLLSVSCGPEADFSIRPCGSDASSFEVHERSTGQSVLLHPQIPGDFFAMDVALAAAVARHLGIPWTGIVDAVQSYTPPAMRWNVFEAGDTTVVDDSYNANPLSMRAALQAFTKLHVPGKRWLVLGGMMELGAAAEVLHQEIGRAAGSGPWAGLVAYGPWGQSIADGAVEAGFASDQVAAVNEHSGVVDQLMSWVKPGDAVLVKASRSERLDEVVVTFLAEYREHVRPGREPLAC